MYINVKIYTVQFLNILLNAYKNSKFILFIHDIVPKIIKNHKNLCIYYVIIIIVPVNILIYEYKYIFIYFLVIY